MNGSNREGIDLSQLRDAAHQTLLRDVSFTPGLAERIVSRANGSESPVLRKSRRFRQRLVPALSGVAVVVLFAGAGLWYVESKHTQTSPIAFTEGGYHATDAQLVERMLQGVESVRYGNGTIRLPAVGKVTVPLNPGTLQVLTQDMQQSQVKELGTQPNLNPWIFTYTDSIEFLDTSGKAVLDGYVRGDGSMFVTSETGPTKNQDYLFAPNSNLRRLIQQALMPSVLAEMERNGKKPQSTPQAAALAYVQNSANPVVAYQYCVRDVVLESETMTQIADDSTKYGYNSYVVQDVQYGFDNTAAVVQLAPMGRWTSHPVAVRVQQYGDKWLISEIGSQLKIDAVHGASPGESFGSHSILVIGDEWPSVPSRLSVSMVQHGDQPDYSKSDVIVYELPKSETYDSDRKLVSVLQSDSMFQTAIDWARKNHKVVVVYGYSGDHLSNKLVQEAAGTLNQGTYVDSQPAVSVTVSFVSDVPRVFSQIWGGAKTPEDFTSKEGSDILNNTIDEAALELDMFAIHS